MKIERGLHTSDLRINVILQSEDVDTHSEMTKNQDAFEGFADDLMAQARMLLRKVILKSKDVR
jgi:hypothetical protein